MRSSLASRLSCSRRVGTLTLSSGICMSASITSSTFPACLMFAQRRFAAFTLSHNVPHFVRAKNVKTCLKSIVSILQAGPAEGVLLSDVARELPDEQMEAMEDGLRSFVLGEAKEIIAVRKNAQGKVILCLYSNDSLAVSAGESTATSSSSVTSPVRAPAAPPAPRGAPIPQAPPPTAGVPVAQGPPTASDGSLSPSNYIISLPLVERFLPPRELPGMQAKLLIELMSQCPLKAFSLLTAVTSPRHVEGLIHMGFSSPITRSFRPFTLVALRKDWRCHVRFDEAVFAKNTQRVEGDSSEAVTCADGIVLYDTEVVEAIQRIQDQARDSDPTASFLSSYHFFATLNSQYAEQVLDSEEVQAAVSQQQGAVLETNGEDADQFEPPALMVADNVLGEAVEEYDVMRVARFVPVEDFIPIELLLPLAEQVTTRDTLHVLLSAPDLFEFDNKHAPTAVRFLLSNRYVPALFSESLEEIAKEVVLRCNARRNEKQQRKLGEHKRKIELAKIALSMKMLGRQSLADPRVLSMFVFDIMNENPVELPQIESAIFGVTKKMSEGSLQFYNDFENDMYNLFLPPDLVASMREQGVVSPYLALRAIKQQIRSPITMRGGGDASGAIGAAPSHNSFANDKWKQGQILQEQGISARIPTPCPFVFNQAFYRYAPVYEKFPHLFYVFETAQRNRMISRADLKPPAAAETQRELTPEDILTVMKQAVDGAQQSQTPNAILPFLEEGKQQGVPDLITYANIGSVSRQLPLFVCKRIRAMYHGVNKSVFAGYLNDHPEVFEHVLLAKSGTYFVRLRRNGVVGDRRRGFRDP